MLSVPISYWPVDRKTLVLYLMKLRLHFLIILTDVNLFFETHGTDLQLWLIVLLHNELLLKFGNKALF